MARARKLLTPLASSPSLVTLRSGSVIRRICATPASAATDSRRASGTSASSVGEPAMARASSPAASIVSRRPEVARSSRPASAICAYGSARRILILTFSPSRYAAGRPARSRAAICAATEVAL
ncbi:hypothetical protein [Lysobacter gummosus]|uniref:hypothetical protein n=1 Tax=Lysobacter gummosus TaxID=262324 RepID=UPI003632729C